ncbi:MULTISPECIES: proline dehydrogenase family protein [unclassified Crossiella]|uniref:proline dehydrogenase family protein n=1 Tax=unclassified Crossiella TaxID=2620835 RepID=UPI0020004101|nr:MULTISPECIES: proline dehydrogenase family protein [unclassified Crossiella]MCK2236705.1 proline dehydrogenase family protein [Crossiella sp. S99.2]MCK2250373.1 proline dehydrogenase family protein [Crossiella sp. S99.1]
MNPLRALILAAAGNNGIRRLVGTAPVSRDVVRRFVAGESTAEAVVATSALVDDGLTVTLDYLGEDTTDRELAEVTVQSYLELLDQLHSAGLSGSAEVSVKLSAVGQALDERLALDNASRICAAAEQCGTTVTLDMEDHTTTDSTLRVLGELRRSWPWVGAVLQAYLRRTLDDCRELAGPGSRVRLCKGAYKEPESVAYQAPHEVDLSYVRCANTLLQGDGYPMFATHDPRLVGIIDERARWHDRKPGTYEYQMLYGIRPEEQLRLAQAGETVRVYIPYGQEWYGYLMRRLAERPANTAFFLRALASKR